MALPPRWYVVLLQFLLLLLLLLIQALRVVGSPICEEIDWERVLPPVVNLLVNPTINDDEAFTAASLLRLWYGAEHPTVDVSSYVARLATARKGRLSPRVQSALTSAIAILTRQPDRPQTSRGMARGDDTSVSGGL